MNKIFVYGTLMSEFPNNVLISRYQDSVQITRQLLISGYAMHSLGGFPMIIGQGQGFDVPWSTRIYGELWEVNDECLKDLDDLEGHPNWYSRISVKVGSAQAFLYLGNSEYLNKNSCGIVPSGSWRSQIVNRDKLITDWRRPFPKTNANLYEAEMAKIEKARKEIRAEPAPQRLNIPAGAAIPRRGFNEIYNGVIEENGDVRIVQDDIPERRAFERR